MSDQTIFGFLAAARENETDALEHHDGLMHLLNKVDDRFWALMNPRADDNALARIMVMNAHAYFLAGVRIALSGQSPPVFASLRNCLECALYGLIVQEVPGSDRAGSIENSIRKLAGRCLSRVARFNFSAVSIPTSHKWLKRLTII